MIRFKRDDGSNYPEWEEKLLKEVALFFNGDRSNRYPKDNDFVENGICFLNTENLHDTVLNIKAKCKYITIEKYNELSGAKIELLDTIYCLRGSVGLCALNTFLNEGTVASSLMVIRAKKEMLEPVYMNCLLKSNIVLKQVSQCLNGSCAGNLSAKDVGLFLIPIPCLEEQKKIADFLSHIDDVIVASEQEITTLEEQKKGVMQKIFSQEVRFKADDGSDYPEWEEKSVKELTLFHKQGYYTKEEYVENGIKLARVSDLFNPKVDFESMPMIDISERDYEAFKVSVGDFLIARSGSIGRYGIVTEIPEDIKVVFGSFVIKFNFDENLLSTKYFGEFYSSDFALRQLKRIIQAGANVNINAENIKTIKVPLPCIEEQKKIANFLSDMDTAIDLAKQELEQWKELKKGLLQQLFE